MGVSRRGWGAAVAVAAALAVLASGCSAQGDDGPSQTPQVSFAEAQQLLNARARAVRNGNLRAFLRSLDRQDPALVSRQRRYFRNLQQLPLGAFRYRVLESQWPDTLRGADWDPDTLLAQVRLVNQLTGFDEVPVSRVTGFAFAREDGRPVIISETTGAGAPFPGSNPAPWDLTEVRIRQTEHTLEVYDARTWPRAAEVGEILEDGIEAIADGLPFEWSEQVVVYVFQRKDVLESYEGVPGGNIRHLGAMTFPIYASLGEPEIAGVRFTLLPSSLRADRDFLERITRHELTHVAVGERDDGAPVWVAEGIAEYMSARNTAPAQRRIATVAVERARGTVQDMPASADFNGEDQAWNYALAWMACDYIAQTQGEDKMWAMMNALHADGAGTADEDQDPVLRRILGLNSHQLARRAARRITAIYG